MCLFGIRVVPRRDEDWLGTRSPLFRGETFSGCVVRSRARLQPERIAKWTSQGKTDRFFLAIRTHFLEARVVFGRWNASSPWPPWDGASSSTLRPGWRDPRRSVMASSTPEDRSLSSTTPPSFGRTPRPGERSSRFPPSFRPRPPRPSLLPPFRGTSFSRTVLLSFFLPWRGVSNPPLSGRHASGRVSRTVGTPLLLVESPPPRIGPVFSRRPASSLSSHLHSPTSKRGRIAHWTSFFIFFNNA